jgi:hypothetical protein
MYKKGKVMKNNVVFGLRSLEKVMKSMLLLAISLMVFSADAGQAARKAAAQRRGAKQQNPRVSRNVRGQALPAQIQPQTPATPLTKGAMLVNTALANNPNVKRNQLSARAQVIVQDVEEDAVWESAWDRDVARIQNADEKKFLEDLRSVLAKKKEKLAGASLQEEMFKTLQANNRELKKMVSDLRKQLAMQNKGFFRNMYESVASMSPALALSAGVGTAVAWWKDYSWGGGALVAASVLGMMGGLNYVAEKLATGELSDAVGKVLGENVITQYTNDRGKYPTFDSLSDGIMRDIQNTSKLDQDTFENYRRTVLAQVENNKKIAFEENPALKAAEEKIDDQIKVIRDRYFKENPKEYMQALADIKNIANLAQAQAILSEYLRAGFREEQNQLLLKSEEEEKAEETVEKPKANAFWRLFGY